MAFDPLLILRGDFSLGVTDVALTSYKADVHEVTIKRTRDTIEIPATFGTGRKEQRGGATAEEMTLNLTNDLQSTSLWALLWDTIDDQTGLLFFEAVFLEGVVSATNPAFTGQLLVTGADIGGASGGRSVTSLTVPIIGGVAKVIVP